MKIKRLLIANRGEILRRIALTAKTLGIETVSIWPDDAPPPHVLRDVIDKFVSTQSASNAYLDSDLLIQIAKEHRCDAVHPGFGFLSENAGFASACIDAGLVWVGPTPDSMTSMASKDTSRTIARQSGVPVNDALEGFNPATQEDSLEKATAFAKSTGFPLLVKAALGGGGKGMRLVEHMDQLEEAIQRGHSEAVSAFGDGTLLIERYITSPRHVEVQVFGDKHGNVYALGDRDCSLQRRHQKIIEEAPAPNLAPDTRMAMQRAAVNLAKSVGYDSAGTVEFLVDASAPDHEAFYFLEMNTRLQVEHPVTEEVFGVDLVAWQLRVACGETLPDWSKLQPRGHAVEARIYAEDCQNNYLPCPGAIYDFRPAFGLGMRWETGIDRSDKVDGRYDPMIAKAIAFAPTRTEALARLASSLHRTALFGITTNIGYLITLLKNHIFQDGAVTTHFLKDQHTNILEAWDSRAQSSIDLIEDVRSGTDHLFFGSTPATDSRLSTVAQRRQQIFQSADRLTFSPQDAENCFVERYHDHGGTITSGRFESQDGPVSFCIFKGLHKSERWFTVNGVVFRDEHTKASLNQYMNEQLGDGDLTAPVPGKIVSVKANAGDQLASGDVVLVLESMKLEFEVKADRNGEIAQVHVTTGMQVSAGDTLVSWNAD